jgi:hypothetical protein
MKLTLVEKAMNNSNNLKPCNFDQAYNVWYVGSDDLLYTNDLDYIPENGMLMDYFDVGTSEEFSQAPNYGI